MDFIGFPPPLLGSVPLRLPILFHDKDLIALFKPPGIGISEHIWYRGIPCLSHALREQIEKNKSELSNLGIHEAYPVFSIDPEISGIALFALNQDKGIEMRNAFGSSLLSFECILLTQKSYVQSPKESLSPEFECNLPIAPHFKDQRMFISSRSGKKSMTHFKLISEKGLFQLWTATTLYYRLHQIRIHAAESGLAITGEHLYSQAPFVYLKDIQKVNKGTSRNPLYSHIGMHIQRISFDNTTIQSPPLKAFQTLLKKIGLG